MDSDSDDGESTYLVVYNPWPRCGLPWDTETKHEICCWLACFIPRDLILALYTRPQPSDVVIVEVSPNVRDFSAILGAHKWSYFDPASRQSNSQSRIFRHKKKTWDDVIRKPAWDNGQYSPLALQRHWNLRGQEYPKPEYCTLEFLTPGAPKYAVEMDLPAPPPPAPLHPTFRDPRLQKRALLPSPTVVQDPYLLQSVRTQSESPSVPVTPEPRALPDRPHNATPGPSITRAIATEIRPALYDSEPTLVGASQRDPSSDESRRSAPTPTPERYLPPGPLRSESPSLPTVPGLYPASMHPLSPSSSNRGSSTPSIKLEPKHEHQDRIKIEALDEDNPKIEPLDQLLVKIEPLDVDDGHSPNAAEEIRSSAPPGVRGRWMERLEDEDDEADIAVNLELREEELERVSTHDPTVSVSPQVAEEADTFLNEYMSELVQEAIVKRKYGEQEQRRSVKRAKMTAS